MATKRAKDNDEDIEMKPSGTGSPVKIDYELYNEEFGEGSSGNLSISFFR